MARAVELTHADRAYRREKVLAALATGERSDGVAARFGLSKHTVLRTAQRAGLRLRVGRPPNPDDW